MISTLLFLKAPRIGDVKTRLAQHIGAERALATYRALVERQFHAIPEEDLLEVHFTPLNSEAEMQNWLGERPQYYAQREGGLGERLEAAVEAAFTRGAQSVICIGGDCPQLGRQHFEQALAQLNEGKDVAFGPSEDGGYYLIALSHPQPELFRDIPWSEPDTLEKSLEKAKALNLKIGLLETLYDVDGPDELNRALDDGLIEL